jgi:hypothetical protein
VCSEIPSNSTDRPTVGTVPRQVEIEDHIALDAHCIAVGEPDRNITRQHDDPGGVGTKSEFDLRTQHAYGLDTKNSSSLDSSPVGHLGAQRCESDHITFGHIRSPAPDVALVTIARINPNTTNLCRVWVLFHPQDLRGNHTWNDRSNLGDRLHSKTEGGEFIGKERNGLGIGWIRERTEVV